MANSRAACVVLVLVVSLAAAFNVDTVHPVIFRGPVTDPTGRQTRADTYFGYAVSLGGTRADDGPWLLTGAPRANSTLGINPPSRIVEPGALFKCPLRRGAECQEVLVDRTGNDPDPERRYTDLKDQGWLGGTMDYSRTGWFAVSGFRWRNTRYSNKYLGNGVCYVETHSVSDDGFRKSVPLYDKNSQNYITPDRESRYFYSYGQAGTSIHFPENGHELILGAPGVINWRGTLIRYNEVDDLTQGIVIPNPYVTKILNDNDYFGYSVGSGIFSGDSHKTLYLAGAPRGAAGKGRVLMVDFPQENDESFSIQADWTGSSLGEYFGAAVLAVDLNGDGLSDVVVGAPLFAEDKSYDQGRIYVYMNSDRGVFKSARTSIGSGMAHARFGSTLAALGDIDHDGFLDFAVGAPYEEDGRGAVYIFRGGPGDFVTTASQRIAASELNGDLRGFGVSISRGVDVDRNQYPDLAVGSYASGDAVLLRTRPVLQFVAKMTANPEKLAPDSRGFGVQACLTFRGQFVPAIVAVNVTVKVESFHAQSVLVVNDQDVPSLSQRWKVTKEDDKCQHYTVAIRSGGSTIDFTKPIQLSMGYDLISNIADTSGEKSVFIETDTSKRSPRFQRGRRTKRQLPFPSDLERIDDFCSTCPVPNVNMGDQKLTLLSVPFAVGCGSDSICNTDMKIAYSFLHFVENNTYVIGSSKTLDLELQLTNSGEPASLPIVTLLIPSPVGLARIPPSCQEQNDPDQGHVNVTCTVQPHPFYDDSHFKISLRLDLAEITSQYRSLKFNASVTSTAVETDPRDNIANITLTLVEEADLEIVGKSFQDDVFYEKEEDRAPEDKGKPYYLTIEHIYEIFKYLPSPVEAAAISFLIPIGFDHAGNKVNFLQLYPPSAQIGERPFNCSMKKGNFIQPGQADDKGDELQPTDKPSRRQKPKTDVSFETLPKDSTKLLNCTRGGHVQCVRMTCQMVSFPDPSTRATVHLRMKLDVVALRPLLTVHKGATVVTHGFVHLLNGSRIAPDVNQRPDITAVSTKLLPSTLEPQPVAIWIIVVAVLGALLLLGAIVYIMHRAGFFKRTKRDQLLEERQEAEETKRLSTVAE